MLALAFVLLAADPSEPLCGKVIATLVDFAEPAWTAEEWRTGDAPPHVPARSPRAPAKFKAFRSELDAPMDWDIIDGSAEVWSTWEAFTRTVA